MAATVSTVAWVRAGLIDQLNLCVADFIIGARPVFGGRRAGLCWDGDG